jgi:sulfur carrier protein
MKLRLNGDVKEFSTVDTIVTLLDELGIDRDAGGVAIAVNGSVVSKTKWSDINLNDGDEVEIIHAVQGG